MLLRDLLERIAGRCSPLAAEAVWLRWLVVQDPLDLLHDLIRKLGQELDRLDIVVDLMGLRGAKDDRAHVRVLDAPGKRQLADVATK